MKAVSLLFSSLLMTASFACSSCPRAEHRFRSGDLIFVGIASERTDNSSSVAEDSMSAAIVSATGDGRKDYIHVAIVDVDKSGEIFVIDADDKRGVSRHTLESLIEDYRQPEGSTVVFDVMRLRRFSRFRAGMAVERACVFIGEDYDLRFLPDNSAHYCSELVFDSFLDRRGRHVFSSQPMNFLSDDGSLPHFWEELFSGLGMPVPQGVQGTNPQDMSCDPRLKMLDIKL